MTPRPIVFIAGPLRDASASQVAANVLTAQAAVVRLVELGCTPYGPHCNIGHALGVIEEADAHAVNQVFLDLAEALLVLPGWSRSAGTRHEVAYARARKKPILFSPQEVTAWLHARPVALGNGPAKHSPLTFTASPST